MKKKPSLAEGPQMLCFYVLMFCWSLPAVFFCWQDSDVRQTVTQKTYVCILIFVCFFLPIHKAWRGCPQAFFCWAQKHKNTPFPHEKFWKYSTPTTGAKDKRHGRKYIPFPLILWRNKSDFNMFSCTKIISFQNIMTLPKYYDSI